MNDIDMRAFKKGLAVISRLWEKQDYNAALAEVDRLLTAQPGNGHLHILWASLVQLQEAPTHSLDDAKVALQIAFELEKSSPVAAIELGNFLDAVDDDALAASKAYSEGIALARQLLIDGLIGQAKAQHQLEKKEEALRCLLEALNLMHFQTTGKRTNSDRIVPDLVFGSPSAGLFSVQLKGRLADQFEELLTEVVTSRSA